MYEDWQTQKHIGGNKLPLDWHMKNMEINGQAWIIFSTRKVNLRTMEHNCLC